MVQLYLNLLEASLAGMLFEDASFDFWSGGKFDLNRRLLGRDWPSLCGVRRNHGIVKKPQSLRRNTRSNYTTLRGEIIVTGAIRKYPRFRSTPSWRFFAPENFITRLTGVLETETQVFQVELNFADAVKLTDASAAEQAVHRAPDAGHYVLTDLMASGPAMFDTARLDRAGGVRSTDTDPVAALKRRAAAAGLRTASLDEMLCVTAV